MIQMRAIPWLGLLMLCCALARAGEPPQPIHPWYSTAAGEFKFTEGENGEKTIEIGNQIFVLTTVDQLLSNPNPGLAHRNVAVIGEIAIADTNPDKREWFITLVGYPKIKFVPPSGQYAQNVKMVQGLRGGYHVLVTGEAKVSEDNKSSTIMVDKPYRIPLEVDRLTAEVGYLVDQKPNYENLKKRADELEVRANVLGHEGDEHAAKQLRDLRAKCVDSLLSLQDAMYKTDRLSVDEMFEYIKTIQKFSEDQQHAADVLKKILEKAPTDKRAIEGARVLLPDWLFCEGQKKWMAKKDCDNYIAIEQAKIDAQRKKERDAGIARSDLWAKASDARRFALVKFQAQMNDNNHSLPAEASAGGKALDEMLQTSDDYRLVQEILMLVVAEVDRKEWLRVITPSLLSKNSDVRLLGYKLAAFSNDPATTVAVAGYLVKDSSNSVQEDAVLGMSEVRSPSTVLALVKCLTTPHANERLNQTLLEQLQRLTGRHDSDPVIWVDYVKDPAKITIVPE